MIIFKGLFVDVQHVDKVLVERLPPVIMYGSINRLNPPIVDRITTINSIGLMAGRGDEPEFFAGVGAFHIRRFVIAFGYRLQNQKQNNIQNFFSRSPSGRWHHRHLTAGQPFHFSQPQPGQGAVDQADSNPYNCCPQMVTTTPEITTGRRRSFRKKPRMKSFWFRK